MKKILCVLIFSAFITNTLSAQSILNRVRNKAEQRANQKIDQTIDKGLDKAEETIPKEKSAAEKADNGSGTTAAPATTEATSTDANTVKTKSADLPIKAYASFDFVPGDSVIFEDDFRTETLEEIPSLWIPTGGVVEMTKINGETVVGFLDGFYTGMYPRMKKYNYLPQRFSVEFDYLFRMNSNKPWGKNMADGGSASLNVIFHSEDIDFNSETMGDYVNDVQIESDGRATFKTFRGQYKGITDPYGETEIFDKWVHVSIAGTERGIKIYLNNQRIVNAAIASGKASSITIKSEGNTVEPGSRQLFIRNVRIVAGGKDPYKQLTSSAKTYIARGIRFEYDKATLKPESMGEINRVLAMIKEHPDLKFEIGGHSDSDGDDAYNQKLSQQRAESVKTKLVELGVDANRLTAKGFGESKPLSDNETPEGKANNRRVEFVSK